MSDPSSSRPSGTGSGPDASEAAPSGSEPAEPAVDPLHQQIDVRRILLPLDASDRALQPLGLAAELARALRADLHFLWVDAADQAGRPAPEFPSRAEVDEAVWLAEPERLREASLASTFRPSLTRALAYGPNAATVIADYCSEHAIDLVIMATRRRGMVSRLFDSSTATEVVRHAPCSVLVVPDDSLEDVIAIPPQVLVAIDFSDESLTAMAVAGHLRSWLESDLYLLHAEPAPHAEEASGLASLTEEDSARSRSHLARVAQRVGVEGELLVRRGGAAGTILRVVDEVDADLLVMGSHGRKGVQRLLLGSVAERMIAKSPVPVLVVRANRAN